MVLEKAKLGIGDGRHEKLDDLVIDDMFKNLG